MIDLPLVSLDLELSGDGDAGEIIEIGAVKFRADTTLDTIQVLVQPRQPISHRIEELTGLSNADFSEALPHDTAIDLVGRFVGNSPLVGQSIGHDVRHLRRAGLALSNPLLDTFELAILLRPGLATYDLLSIANALEVPHARPHRALADALLARDVFLALCREAERLDVDVLGQIARLAGPLDWPLKLVFAELQRAKVRDLLESGELAARSGRGTLLPPMTEPEQPEPLTPSPQPTPIDREALDAMLRPGGAIASALPGFEDREEQRAMLGAVADALDEGNLLVVEAGTGTGKSLAYLLPSLDFSVRNGRRVVISTNTINLQDQLQTKDIPVLLEATGSPARVAILKGRTNYLCLRRWLNLLEADELSPGERMLLIKTLLWLPLTQTGDRGELRLSPAEDEAWGRVAATTESCSPLRCRFHREGRCWVARARRQAEGAHLVIVNHALLLADMSSGSQVLPDHDHLVIDEAHHLEDEATSQLGEWVGQRELLRRLERLDDRSAGTGLLAEVLAAIRGNASEGDVRMIGQWIANASRVASELGDALKHVCALAVQILKGAARGIEGGQPALRVTGATRAQPAWSDLDVAWGEASRRVLELERALGELALRTESLSANSEALGDLAGELLEALGFWSSIRALLNRVVAETDLAVVAWLTLGIGDEVGFHIAPLDVGELLEQKLFEPREATVLTSATLTVQGSFKYIRQRLGLRDAEELAVGSPFDYQRAALVLLPADSPEPNQPGYQRAVEQIILDVVTELNGRTLVLFTSYSQLRATYQALHERLDARKLILLGQRIGGTSRARLLETFKSGAPCVLLGTSSFWEGIDVVGDALSCVIMARLPFAPPTDPIVEARAEQFEDPFRQYTLPQAALRFRQGFGRLIRSKADRGVMIVLDGRLRTRNYRWAFLRSLPPCPVHTCPAEEAGRIARGWIGSEAASVSAVQDRRGRRDA